MEKNADKYFTKLITIAIILILLELILFLLNRTGLMYIPHFPLIGYTVVGAVFALAVFYAVREGSIYTRILNFPPLRFLGKISFGIYIYHFPLLFICEAWHLP